MKTSTFQRTPSIFAIIIGILLLNGCASTSEPPAPMPKPYEIHASADAIINRDIAGKPLSVVVRLYQLKQEKEFDLLTFDLATSSRTDAELFGDSLIKRSEILMIPGTTHISTQMLLPETKYLGVVAFFRSPDPHYWRYLIDADQVRAKGLTFQALDCYLHLKDMKAATIPGQPLDASPVCSNENIAAPAAPAPAVAEKAPIEKPRKYSKSKRAIPVKTTSTTATPAVNSAPVIKTARPSTPLPTPPEPTTSVPAVNLPTVNVNVTPTLGLPKWGIQ